MPDIYEVAWGFQGKMLTQERAAASEMVRYYGQAWQRIDNDIKRLLREYYASPNPNPNWLYQYERLSTLRAQTEEQIRAFANFANQKIQTEQLSAIIQAQTHADDMIRAGMGAMPDQAGLLILHRVNINAVASMIGFLQDGSPLAALLEKLGPEAAQIVEDGLVQGMILGQNPNKVARNIRKGLGDNLTRALRIARTEQLRAYRESLHQSYRANADVLNGWIWVSACNERTCGACYAKHGTKHSLEEQMDEHVSGRCTPAPWTKSWSEIGMPGIGEPQPDYETGAQAFERLTEKQKLTVLGPSKYAAYRDGLISIGDLAGTRVDKRWGPAIYEKSLKELGLSRGKMLRRYRSMMKKQE